ncbi:MAG TPA: hypothetical protein VFY26_06290 [Anaerolineales bacterium]|nr:hypothetical protein [Anaerolineales bacterium]
MSLRKTLFVISLLFSTLCLAAGYGIARHWTGMIIAILLAPTWWLARKHPGSGLPFVCLSSSVGLAVIGRLTGSTALWMILGSATALAAWDLLFLDSALGNTSPGAPTRQYENQHLRALLLALGCALLAILVGRFVTIQLPFVILLLSLAFLLFSLDRVWGSIKKRSI